MKNKITIFWFAMTAHQMSGRGTVSFNAHCFEWADKLGLSYEQMNRAISAWACTINTFPPAYLLNNYQ